MMEIKIIQFIQNVNNFIILFLLNILNIKDAHIYTFRSILKKD